MQLSLRQAGLTAGWGLLLMTFFALYAFYYVFENLIVPEDVNTTVENIMGNEQQFRIGICSYLVVIILDILVAWALYVFLKPVNSNISLLTAWFRLIYSGIYAVALANYFKVLEFLNSTELLSESGRNGLNAEIMLSLNAFNDTWAIGFAFFGLHLFLLGYLAFKADYVPKIWGVLLLIAGLSYLIDYFFRFLFPEVNLPLSTYLGWGEPVFMFWLLFKGGKSVQKK
ncbi:DUF4386 family protein [Muricauda sp. JGD-17]|uniref:DUF4386 family protein n=2 Tax=Flagellimonas ochracea TaxID=2696472 RepID=A0A964TAM5_9FLAO|nr:DUF4386 family protein [Allomuricauda ochracea]